MPLRGVVHSSSHTLKERVCAKVRLHNPKTLDEAAHLALDFAEFLCPLPVVI